MSDHIIVSPFVQQGKKRPHNWQGGRVVASNGYVLIHVGKEHHLGGANLRALVLCYLENVPLHDKRIHRSKRTGRGIRRVARMAFRCVR